MNADLYHAQYFGGPCDGMVVVATHRYEQDTWSLPVAAPNGPANSDGLAADNFQAVYKLRRICHLIERGAPMTRYEFEFVGLEIVAPVTRSLISSWLACVTDRLSRLQPNLWLPLPEGRPKRPGQAVRLLSCLGRGLGLGWKRATSLGPIKNRGSASHLDAFRHKACAKH